MSYSIMRVSKVKQSVNTTGIQKHVQRENNHYNNKDIDHKKTYLNYDLVHGDHKVNVNALINQRIEEGYTGQRKIRKDAIKHIDGIITSDEHFFDGKDLNEVERYFRDSLDFIKQEYGEKNMLYATVHLDENTPHMHFGVVPLTEEGRLSAKEMVGNKTALTKFQDRYNQFMNEKGFPLDRGQSKLVTEAEHEKMDTLKKNTRYHETQLEQTQQKAQQAEEKLNELTSLLTYQSVPYESQETVTEVKDKMFGKSEIVEKETDNVVLTPQQVETITHQLNAAHAIKKDYDRLKDTNLVKRNKELEQQFEEELFTRVDYENKNMELKQENKQLKQENRDLKSHVKNLETTMKIWYISTQKTLKDRFKTLKKTVKEIADRRDVGETFDQLDKKMVRKQSLQKQNAKGNDLSL